tara:strand:- start:291 stop:437 length:147 start_codon:yes stop_codon:yes gene_type:complete
MTTEELVIHTLLFAFAVVVIPLAFTWLDEPSRKIFDKSDLEYKDGDNT